MSTIDEEEAYALEDAASRAREFLFRAVFRFIDAEKPTDTAQTMVALVLALLTDAAVIAQTTGVEKLGTKTGFMDMAGAIFEEQLDNDSEFDQVTE